MKPPLRHFLQHMEETHRIIARSGVSPASFRLDMRVSLDDLE